MSSTLGSALALGFLFPLYGLLFSTTVKILSLSSLTIGWFLFRARRFVLFLNFGNSVLTLVISSSSDSVSVSFVIILVASLFPSLILKCNFSESSFLTGKLTLVIVYSDS